MEGSILRIPAYKSHYAIPASHRGERPALPAAGSFAVVSLDPGINGDAG